MNEQVENLINAFHHIDNAREMKLAFNSFNEFYLKEIVDTAKIVLDRKLTILAKNKNKN